MGFAGDHLTPLVDEGLGNSAYLVDLGDGRALAVDASRDLRALRAAAARRGLTVAFAADTHLHADFLSGAVQLAADDGAAVLASAAGNRAFPHTPLGDGDETDLGGLTLRALATPGHTDEHLSFLLLDGARELGVFTGGSLIVGSAARTDLLGADRAEELARAQYRSLQRLAKLPDATAVWPTHGAGSFCSAPPGAERTTTIAAQKQANLLLAAPDEDAFVRELLGSLGSYPAYFDRLGEINRRGPAVIGSAPTLAALTTAETRQLLDQGAQLVDVRPVADFAAGHIPGAISIPLRDQFATWLGWLLPDDVPLVFVTAPGQDLAELTWQSLKIGYERLAGHLDGGMAAWTADGGPQQTIALVTAERIVGRPVLDVRQRAEHTTGHIADAVHIELGELVARTDEAPDGALVHCGHGERAMTAASLLQRAGHRDLAVLDGGPGDWSKVTGRPLEETA
ncbi:MBL fold metallo-hydrolase [Streptomyces lunaelactis]|uniref:MBL fold metallo-hydrolase n=1 Tax=Streptomyces lunaelactis TaxID=1535768 RepID=UPI001584EC9F|nr:MBL fold metallo-hydrolase [Streptomyces lunaelactis]NUK49136.1 MBL fold metallo-hydrolase [Streptomyces lunaelactis]NUK49152.1 MBL fold metallo-hydrolase [Streptomyces lunaelactis]NUK63312.1 MBL fold metallo-hydrolase [Streptomyces lunaelactis]NUK63328.1 MBL fold metallo-hydrolase [Streptomyces lunaelactis]